MNTKIDWEGLKAKFRKDKIGILSVYDVFEWVEQELPGYIVGQDLEASQEQSPAPVAYGAIKAFKNKKTGSIAHHGNHPLATIYTDRYYLSQPDEWEPIYDEVSGKQLKGLYDDESYFDDDEEPEQLNQSL